MITFNKIAMIAFHFSQKWSWLKIIRKQAASGAFCLHISSNFRVRLNHLYMRLINQRWLSRIKVWLSGFFSFLSVIEANNSENHRYFWKIVINIKWIANFVMCCVIFCSFSQIKIENKKIFHDSDFKSVFRCLEVYIPNFLITVQNILRMK